MTSETTNTGDTPWLEDIGHCLIVHNRHNKRGALTPAFYETILQAIEASHSPIVRSIIITGGPFFCAGGDLKLLKTRAALSIPERQAKIELLHSVIRAQNSCQVPMIAAIEGGAAGAGLSIALMCDLIVAAQNSAFTAAYVKAGLTPDGGLTKTLTQLLPRQIAMEMCLLGRPVSAERLAQNGVVTELCSQGQALAQAKTLAQVLAKGPPEAQSGIRRLILDAPLADFETHLDRESARMAQAQGTSEAAEGIAAFLEKRPPNYR